MIFANVLIVGLRSFNAEYTLVKHRTIIQRSFCDATKMVSLGSRAKRTLLTRKLNRLELAVPLHLPECQYYIALANTSACEKDSFTSNQRICGIFLWIELGHLMDSFQAMRTACVVVLKAGSQRKAASLRFHAQDTQCLAQF